MKITATFALLATIVTTVAAQDNDPKVKTGWNFGPLPAISYSSDLGFQYGVLCDAFYYGDGSTYPQYMHKFNVEVSRYTKGSGMYHLFYDSKFLIPNIRVTFATTYNTSSMQPFYGFNGFASPFDAALAAENPAFYAFNRDMFRVIADFQGKITDRIGWAGGLAFWNFRTGRVQLDKYSDVETLWDLYTAGPNPIIPEHQQNGGSQLEFKAGLVYDTRDHEPAPNRGLYVEMIAFGSPDVFERQGNEYLKLSANIRQYFTLLPQRVVFAYKIAYQGTVAGEPPFYMQQNISTLYLRQITSEGLGGRSTLRGILLNRMVGDGYAWGNFEFRCRLFDFRFLKQDWYFGVNPFLDAGMVVQPYRLDEMRASTEPRVYSGDPEQMHFSSGIGAKVVMNYNFIVSAEWGKPFDKRDGNGTLSIGLNYTF